MTRRSDLMCEDLFGCDHSPDTPISEGGVVVEWRCRCGRRVRDPGVESTKRALNRMLPSDSTRESSEAPRLTAEVIRDRLRHGAANAAALDEQLERVFVLREQSALDPVKMGARFARFGEICSKHDPCTMCGHGRLLHKRQAYVDPGHRARDEALPPTQCRGGRYGELGCGCLAWEGVETPVPSLDEIERQS